VSTTEEVGLDDVGVVFVSTGVEVEDVLLVGGEIGLDSESELLPVLVVVDVGEVVLLEEGVGEVPGDLVHVGLVVPLLEVESVLEDVERLVGHGVQLVDSEGRIPEILRGEGRGDELHGHGGVGAIVTGGQGEMVIVGVTVELAGNDG